MDEQQHRNDPQTDSPEAATSPAPRTRAGSLIREAREHAAIPVAKVCADLRISEATLLAIESGDYGRLAGAPYVRATLVSLSRYLRLDSKAVLAAYAAEAGQEPEAPVRVSPYKDDSGTHAKAHKQIFILLLVVLLFILLLIMGKVSTSSPEFEPEAPPAAADTLLNLDPLGDEIPVLPGDSTLGGATGAIPPDTAVTTTTSPETEEALPATRVTLRGLTDSVWVRILPAGAREVSEYIRMNRSLEVSHDEAITFVTRQGRSVRVTVGDTTIVPSGRRFIVRGTTLTE